MWTSLDFCKNVFYSCTRIKSDIAAETVFAFALPFAFAAFVSRRLNEPGVALNETLRGFREIIEGKHDDLPESAFLFVGTIDEAVAKAKKGGQA